MCVHSLNRLRRAKIRQFLQQSMSKLSKAISKQDAFNFYSTSSAEKRILQYIKANNIALRCSRQLKDNDQIQQFYIQIKNKDALNFTLAILAGKDFLDTIQTESNINKEKLSELDLKSFTWDTLRVQTVKEISKKFNSNIQKIKEAVNGSTSNQLEKLLEDLVANHKLSYNTVKKDWDGKKIANNNDQKISDLVVFEVENYYILAAFKKKFIPIIEKKNLKDQKSYNEQFFWFLFLLFIDILVATYKQSISEIIIFIYYVTLALLTILAILTHCVIFFKFKIQWSILNMVGAVGVIRIVLFNFSLGIFSTSP